MKIKLAKSEVIHFVGIGGIGMSGLSLIMKGKGFRVQGSDISNNKNIDFKELTTVLKNQIFSNNNSHPHPKKQKKLSLQAIINDMLS